MIKRRFALFLMLFGSMLFCVDVAADALAQPSLPGDIQWLTNDSDPVFSSDKAETGGILHLGLLFFPLTFRTVGPDSNTQFRSAILDNQMALIGLHPNTGNIIPELATHWAYGKDKKSMFFKLNPSARWSDGHPVTAGDFAYTLEFMRSEHIVAPWYNDYYTREIEKVVVYDEHTLAIVGRKAVPDLHLKLPLSPTPRHFYGELNRNFVREYNWKVAPNTGAYQISDFKKGKYIKFKRKKDWWARNQRYLSHRFNVDYVVYDVVKDSNIMWEYFKKQRLDAFNITLPQFWHQKSRTGVIRKGYVHKIWFYNDTPRPTQGMWLNQDLAIFKDRRVRYAFAHAMNIEKVIEQVLRKDCYRLEQGFVGYGAYTDDTIRARRFDIDKVAELMTAAGWMRGKDGIWQKNGARFSVVVTYGKDVHTPRLVVLKEEAKKAGIELRLQLLDPSTSYKKVIEKKHEVHWGGFGISMRPQYWEHFHSINAHKPQTNNITNTDDPEMDQLVEAYRNALDASERQMLSKKIQNKFHSIGSFVPTFMVPYVRHAYWRWWLLPEIPGTKWSTDLFDPFNQMTGGLFWYDRQIWKETKAAMKERKTFQPVTRVDKTYQIKSGNE